MIKDLTDISLYTPLFSEVFVTTTIYDLTDMSLFKEKDGFVVSATMNEYYVDTSGLYEPGENEFALRDKARELGLSWETTLIYLLEIDGLDIFEVNRNMEIEVYIDSRMDAHILMFNDGVGTNKLD